MLPNPFIGKPKKPTESEVTSFLGSARPLWDKLLEELEEQFDSPDREWHSYSLKSGWSLKVKDGDRTILYMSPQIGCFLVSFALGDKAVQDALRSDLPARVQKMIRGAKRYAEGTAVRMEVKTLKDIPVVKKIAAAKLGN